MSGRRRLSAEEYIEGVRRGDRVALAQAITLIESRRDDHRRQAQAVLSALMPLTGKAMRVGVTGVPGVGKSTFIEALGCRLTAASRKVAVLTVDPSSAVTGGSILGDKTRMAKLGVDPLAYVRPSPNAGSLGGVAAATRETMLLCEAAGFDVILVETVGVGQSETIAAEMTDFFLALMLPGAGDELQGIKRGVLELADMIAVNKADGDNLVRARRAVRDYRNALRYMTPLSRHWKPPVAMCSALTDEGVDQVWRQIEEHRRVMVEAGEWQAKRRRQLGHWLWSLVDAGLKRALRHDPATAAAIKAAERELAAGDLAPSAGAQRILDAFLHK